MLCKYIILPLLQILILACSPVNDNGSGVITVNVKLERNDNVDKIDGFLRFSHFIPLETNDDILINQINKIQIFDNKIFVLDRKQSTVFIFDMDGHFVSKIYRVGRGPHEYLSISDFEATAEGTVIIYDPMRKTFMVYDTSANYRYSIDNIPKTWSFKLLEEDRIALNLANGFGELGSSPAKYNYKVADINGNIIHENIPLSPHVIGQKLFESDYHSLFCRNQGEIYMGSLLNDTIYHITYNGIITPYMAFNYNARRLEGESGFEYTSQFLQSIREGSKPSPPYDFHHFNNAMMAYYSYGHRPYIVIFSTEGNILYSAPVTRDKTGIFTSFNPFIDSDNTGYVLNIATAENIFGGIRFLAQSGKDHSLLSEIASHINKNSNPVLLFYDWVYEPPRA